MTYMDNYLKWLNYDKLDEKLKKELISIENCSTEIKERFYKDLDFGTGGIRGIMGVGTNRINVYTIRKATQGLANYINTSNIENPSVVIAYDSRINSKEYAEECALVLISNNIRVYLFDELRPTPELSFAVRYLKCDAGIVITASHNPKQYNGYKVYGSDGGQITLNISDKIINEIRKIDIFKDIRIKPKINNKLLVKISEEIDNEYLKSIANISINKSVLKESNNFKTVYTPLHGTGLDLIKKIFKLMDYSNLHIVESQSKPDGFFPTIKSPNPEDPKALREGINLAKTIDADIVIGTDPDADRVGVAIKNGNSNYQLLTGNQIGALLTYYIFSNKKIVTSKDALIKTVVTSDLGAKIAQSYGASVFNTLTGFKYIGEKINDFEKENNFNFIFGYEESYGYLAGTFARDKDAIIASMLIVEMAVYYNNYNKNLINVLDTIYKKFGYYLDDLETFEFEGIEGKDKIKTIMNKFKSFSKLNNLFKDLDIVEDYSKGVRVYKLKGSEEKINQSKTELVKIYFKDGSWIAIRPSGTEPKIKFYYSILDDNESNAIKKLINFKKIIKQTLK